MGKRGTKNTVLADLHRRVIATTRRHRMFVLFDATGKAEQWTWWDSKTGKHLLSYWPEWQKWTGHGKSGKCRDWQHAMSIARESVPRVITHALQ